MSYLPHSLEDLINSKSDKNKELMIAEVAVKMLSVVEQFHNLGYIHNDIKPSNFRIKDGEVYIIDFGTEKPYMDKNVHIKENHVGFFGTVEFASIRIH